MRPAVFQKVTDGVIKLKDINGNILFLKKGDTITGYYEMFNGLPGLKFEHFEGDVKATQDPTIKVIDNVYTIVKTPSQQQVENLKPKSFIASDNTEPPDNPNADKECPKCKGKGKYSFGGSYGGPVHWSVCECVMFKPEPPPKPTITKGFEPDVLKSLKSKTPRDWMLVKKHELKKIMDDAGIDYSQVEDERMSLYKFLISILKDLQ